MSTRKEIISSFYDQSDEDRRLQRSRHGQLEPLEERPDFSLSDEDFRSFSEWYLAFAEKRELLGSSSHLLYICRKRP